MNLHDLQRSGECRKTWLDGQECVLTQTLDVTASTGFGMYDGRIVYAGPCDQPALRFRSCDNVSLRGLSIVVANDCHATDLIEYSNEDADPYHTTGGLFEDLSLAGGGRVQRLIYGKLSATLNDRMTFNRVVGGGYTGAGFVLEGRNAKSYEIRSCKLYGKGVARAGIDTSTVPGSGAAFTASNVTFAGHTDADIIIGDRNDTLTIESCYSEDSHRFLRVLDTGPGTSSGRPLPTLLKQIRFATGPSFAADGEAVQFEACGPLEIQGGSWGNETPGHQVKIRFSPKPAPGAFTARGFFANDGDGVVFNGQKPTNDYARECIGYRDGKRVALGAA